MAYEQIIYEPGPVARIILNRPEHRNAQSRLLLEEMDAAFSAAGDDPTVRVIVLSGNGSSFSAGHDLGSPAEIADRERRGYAEEGPRHYDRSRRLFLDYTLHWRNVLKPTIAMVHGYTIFGGWMIASAMDLVFAAEDARLLPTNFQYFSVPWDLGVRRTKEILYENRFMTAQEAHELGFVSRVYPLADLERETLAYANRVAENDLVELAMIKMSVNDMQDGMGFTAAINNAFNAHALRRGLTMDQPRQVEGKRRLTGVGKAFERLRQSEGN
jgi:enoyl-CoA hydratase